MMSQPEALLLVGVFVYFLFGEVQIVFQSAILTLLRYHKNTSQNTTKIQDVPSIKEQLVSITHELLRLIWCHFKVPKWHFEISVTPPVRSSTSSRYPS